MRFVIIIVSILNFFTTIFYNENLYKCIFHTNILENVFLYEIALNGIYKGIFNTPYWHDFYMEWNPYPFVLSNFVLKNLVWKKFGMSFPIFPFFNLPLNLFWFFWFQMKMSSGVFRLNFIFQISDTKPY